MYKQKLILPVSIILGCFILGGFYYLSQVNEQRSIERQQIIKEAEDKKADYFQKKAECEKYSSKIIAGINEDNRLMGDLIMESFEMLFYSPKDNSCLYVIQGSINNGGDREYYIYNALTKSKITSFQFPTQWEDYKKFLLDYSGGEIRL